MKVLVPTDGSEHSMKAIQRALQMAQTEGAKVTLMTVAYYSAEDFDEMLPNIKEKLEADARKLLTEAKAIFDAKGVPVDILLEAGAVPANNIIERAEEGGFDKIVMGSTGRTGLRRVLMGSTAAKVVAHAPCSVTVIR